jgi:hypothetical protein
MGARTAQGQVRDLRVRWALEEVGRRYEVQYLVLGEHKQPPHRARHPFGQVPTYQDSEVTLFESGAIVLHIGVREGGDQDVSRFEIGLRHVQDDPGPPLDDASGNR